MLNKQKVGSQYRIDTKKTFKILNLKGLMAIPERFERPTHSLEGCCSIQLSYGTNRVFIYFFYQIVKRFYGWQCQKGNYNEKIKE